MLEAQIITELITGIGKTKKCCCRTFFGVVGKTLSQTGKMLYSQSGDFVKDRDETVYKWLYENYYRLEETLRNDMLSLGRIKLLCSREKIPVVYQVFDYICVKNPELCEEDICEIFRLCNEAGEGLDIEDTESLLPLLRICVCVRICKCFLSCAEEEQKNTDITIRQLFMTLDELCAFDEEKVFETGKIEKILCLDPYGVYKKLSVGTKRMYRKNLSRMSKRKGVSQKRLAKLIVEKCSKNTGNDRHIGKYLCDTPFGGRTYLFLVFFMTALFTLLLCLVSPVFIVCIFSVYGCARLIADKFFVRFCVGSFRLPQLEIDEIPDRYGVMTVITSLLTGTKSDDGLFERLEKMYFSNGGKNVYFGLLCDLPDSTFKETEKDFEIINTAKEKILGLRKKYGNHFFFFVREREYNSSEEMYIAPERKRGAVNALCSFLCGEDDNFCFGSIKPDIKTCKNIKYVFTLDADTNLAFDCVRKMTGIMMHPQNIPYFDKDKNAVTKGYGILQPAMNPTLESSSKSFFSSVMCGHGGVDLYTLGGSDSIMAMFGKSIFCGKGMFEKNCFFKALCTEENAFKANTVLSHDAPEGARLRCGYVPDVVLTDSFPSEELSYYKRQHRWIRGDIQNIPFLFPDVKNAEGKKIKNGIGAFSKYFIWNNIHSALLPVFTLFSLFVSVLCRKDVSELLTAVALSVYVLPFVNTFFSGAKRRIWHNLRRNFYSARIYTGIWTSFLRMMFFLCAIPKSAFVSVDAVVRSAYRSLVSHKKMLEWTTAAQNDAEKRDGLLGYVKKNLVNALCGCLLFTLSGSGILKLLSLLWLFMPVFAYHSGKQRKKSKKPVDKKYEETLLSYFGDMWKYFRENVNESTNHLPPDNVSLYPQRKISHMTSPTNIGLYLVSVLCAGKLGFADRKEIFGRVSACLSSIEKLEKHKGLLYNWYDVSEMSAMNPKYVSSVDLGNYAACLVVVREGIGDFSDNPEECEKIRVLCDKLLCEADVSLLYDKTRKLFYIGMQQENGQMVFDKNRYDMLMSEARILSFYGVSQRLVSYEHLCSLSRKTVKGKGYMGLASWSGTAFEFFLPEIFLPSKEGSLLYEAMCFAFDKMRHSGVKGKKGYVFGISESCYNELDESLNYKYYAFGVPAVAVKPFEKENVISPYSSFLMLKMSPVAVMKNLKNLRKYGAYGEYGFYESVDFERHKKENDCAVVRCFMSHHVGMSMASVTNFLCDGQVAKWFSGDVRVKSAAELADEKIPYDAYVKKVPVRHYVKNVPKEKSPSILHGEEQQNQTHTEHEKTHLATTKSFSFFVNKSGLCESFTGNKDDGKITEFSDKGRETLLFDKSFDICKNADAFSFLPYGAEYSGEYMKKPYKVRLFACKTMPCKIIVIRGEFSESVDFSFVPSENCDGERQIGAGLVFFGNKEKEKKGFAFGVCRQTETLSGAEYSVFGNVTASLEKTRHSDAEYIFCLGFCDEDKANEIYKRVRKDYKELLSESREFAESVRINRNVTDKEEFRILKKHFSFPEDNSCKRIFVRTDEEHFLFDCFLMMHTSFPDKREYVIKAFDEELSSFLSKAVSCLVFCEYVRQTGDKSVAEFKVRGQTIYKRCIEFFWNTEVSRDERDVFLLAMKRFSGVCFDFGDIRTSVSIKENMAKADSAASEGFFM